MATPERDDPRLVYSCCEVYAIAPLTSDCWVCGAGTPIRLDELAAFHPWKRVEYLGNKQSATRPYI